MKLEKIKPEDATSYQKYRQWIEQIAHAKQKLNDRDNKRKQVAETIRRQRAALKILYKEERDLIEEIETIRSNLIEVLPSRV